VTTIVPNTIAAGINFSATMWRPEFSGAEWVATIILRGPAVIDIASVRDSARHVWDVPGSQTAAWAPGTYAYAVRVTDGNDIHEAERGTVKITPDLSTAVAGHDGRTENMRALDAINAVIEKRASVDQLRYRIRSAEGGSERELERMSVDELLKLRAHFVTLVNAERGSRRGKVREARVRIGPVGS
jgi:hypothetical protein